MTANARQELISATVGIPIKAANILLEDYLNGDKEFLLSVNHTPKELEAFLVSLDFGCCDGFGTQELFGTVWLTDGSWLSRGEYDGSEWWERNILPEIPNCLLR